MLLHPERYSAKSNVFSSRLRMITLQQMLEQLLSMMSVTAVMKSIHETLRAPLTLILSLPRFLARITIPAVLSRSLPRASQGCFNLLPIREQATNSRVMKLGLNMCGLWKN